VKEDARQAAVKEEARQAAVKEEARQAPASSPAPPRLRLPRLEDSAAEVRLCTCDPLRGMQG
jgi:hypothetical protein